MNPADLNGEILLLAYAQGCFPMPDSSGEKIDWYRPDPRAIIPLDGFHVSRSLSKILRRSDFEVRVNTAFTQVMTECGKREETWITDAFIRAYGELHTLGFAHSLEIFRKERCVGGVYGVSLGGAFFAESMFHSEDNMSKVALKALVDRLREKKFSLLECQFLTPHLESLGAIEMSDSEYMKRLAEALSENPDFSN
ncbi:leucyl/phenylalanyl-tRNA--protein transferase [bacterium]|nr:leucyl/phenylalanyl-tRNA--protein transferase [bacterium]